MELSLGPMPPRLCSVVSRLVHEAQDRPPEVDGRSNGFLLTGGPGGCSYLDANGEVWDLDLWDGTTRTVADSPLRVSLIAIASERVPELAEWLPIRPATASDCHLCNRTGWLQPPFPRVQCVECFGLGWLTP